MGEVFPGVLQGIPREAPGITRVAQGLPNEVPRGAQGIPREVGFREARDPLAAWMGWLGWLGSMESPMGYLESVWGVVLG